MKHTCIPYHPSAAAQGLSGVRCWEWKKGFAVATETNGDRWAWLCTPAAYDALTAFLVADIIAEAKALAPGKVKKATGEPNLIPVGALLQERAKELKR